MTPEKRTLGLFAATSVGIGAIVGGGLLALAGTAFATAGPGALLAFAANAVIAVITALTFAELSTAAPRSGGTYLFAKRVLSVGAAFNVGWIVWFASIVAAALYALGFGSFAVGSVRAAWEGAPAWLAAPWAPSALAIATTVLCTARLCRSSGSGGDWINILKVLVFAVLILGGLAVWLRDRPPLEDAFQPFLPTGLGGVAAAMGFTFIVLQGFDLIAAVAGEVKDPGRVLPRAMLYSLGVAMAVYFPLLTVVMAVGVPEGTTVRLLAEENPDTLIAVAARQYLGSFGFWLVMASGLLAMLSALLANLFAASRIAQAMGRDRTLPHVLENVHGTLGTPVTAVLVTGAIASALLLLVRDVASAGAASSLIFLLSFALAHLICILARWRRPGQKGFRVPLWPWLPAFGAASCLALAVFQGLHVPSAGIITGGWLVAGFFGYAWLFGHRARTADAASEFTDPYLIELRGRSPLALVPVANPDSAGPLATLALCLSPRAGRVMLLNVVVPRGDASSRESLLAMGQVLQRSMAVSLQAGIAVECLATISQDPWAEIRRVAKAHRCALTLLGMSNLEDLAVRARVEALVADLPGNVALVRSPPAWKPTSVKRVLCPIGGRGVHNALRARLLSALNARTPTAMQVRYLIVAADGTTQAEQDRLRRMWSGLVGDESGAELEVRVTASNDVAGAIHKASRDCDMILLGLGQIDSKHRILGDLVLRVLRGIALPVILIAQRE